MTTLREKLGRRDLITYEDLEKQYTLQSDPEGFFSYHPSDSYR